MQTFDLEIWNYLIERWIHVGVKRALCVACQVLDCCCPAGVTSYAEMDRVFSLSCSLHLQTL